MQIHVTRRAWLAALVTSSAFFLCAARGAVIQALWVFPGGSSPNPVTDPTARQALVANASASGVTLYYVSVYSSTPNSAGRYMNDETAIAALITKIYAAGGKMYAAYGAPDWPTFGCDPNGFPLQRMAEVTAFNMANPSTKIDGIILDVEPPEPQSASATSRCWRSTNAFAVPCQPTWTWRRTCVFSGMTSSNIRRAPVSPSPCTRTLSA